MSNYTLINDLGAGNNSLQMPMQQQQVQQQQPATQMGNFHHSGDQFEILKKYLNDNDEDENDSEEEDDDEPKTVMNWSHVYGTIMVLLLAIVVFFLYKIHFDLHNSQSSVI